MEAFIGVLLGGGILTFAQFLITRYDNKHDRLRTVIDMIKTLEKKVEQVERKGDERAAIAARVRIIRFGDELQTGKLHSKDAFDQCMSDITFYDEYCGQHPEFRNNQTKMTVQYINSNYAERLEKHDFL